MQRNITCQADKAQRSKNILDPIEHPSVFFRRDGEATKGTSIKAFKRRILRKVEKAKKK